MRPCFNADSNLLFYKKSDGDIGYLPPKSTDQIHVAKYVSQQCGLIVILKKKIIKNYKCFFVCEINSNPSGDVKTKKQNLILERKLLKQKYIKLTYRAASKKQFHCIT